jgi:predicted dehydrogenase
MVALVDLVPGRATARAAQFGVAEACAPAELLADDGTEFVRNLTNPTAHAETKVQILSPGKRAFVEKPLATAFPGGAAVAAEAVSEGLRLGCALDTFLGDGLRAGRPAPLEAS